MNQLNQKIQKLIEKKQKKIYQISNLLIQTATITTFLYGIFNSFCPITRAFAQPEASISITHPILIIFITILLITGIIGTLISCKAPKEILCEFKDEIYLALKENSGNIKSKTPISYFDNIMICAKQLYDKKHCLKCKNVSYIVSEVLFFICFVCSTPNLSEKFIILVVIYLITLMLLCCKVNTIVMSWILKTEDSPQEKHQMIEIIRRVAMNGNDSEEINQELMKKQKEYGLLGELIERFTTIFALSLNTFLILANSSLIEEQYRYFITFILSFILLFISTFLYTYGMAFKEISNYSFDDLLKITEQGAVLKAFYRFVIIFFGALLLSWIISYIFVNYPNFLTFSLFILAFSFLMAIVPISTLKSVKLSLVDQLLKGDKRFLKTLKKCFDIEENKGVLENIYFLYPAIITEKQDKIGKYYITFPDIPDKNVSGHGNSEAEVFMNAKENLEKYLISTNNKPKPSSLKQIKNLNPGKSVIFVFAQLNK